MEMKACEASPRTNNNSLFFGVGSKGMRVVGGYGAEPICASEFHSRKVKSFLSFHHFCPN